MTLLLLLALLPLALPWRIGLLRRPLLPLVAVAALASFARWPSSGSNCRLQWATWVGGGVSCAGPFHLQALYGEVCGFSAWLHRSQGFHLSSIMSYRLLLSYRFTLSFGPSSAPFGCLPLAGLFALLLGPFLVVHIAAFDYSPLACQNGSLLCGLSDGLSY